MKTIQPQYQELVDRLVHEIKKFYGTHLWSIALFGSVARGTAVKDSDLDILIISSGLPCGRMNRVREFFKIEEQVESLLDSMDSGGIHTYISPVFKTPEEVFHGSWLFLDFIDDAMILYDRENFFQNHLNKLSEKLRKLGSRKIRHGDQWYWVLKPDYVHGDIIDL